MFRKFITLFVLLKFTTAFHQYRKLDCTTIDNETTSSTEKTRCHLVLKNEETDTGRNAPEGSGCFKEGSGDDAKVHCAIVCPNAHALTEKDGEWYLWRSGKCLNSHAAFEIGCKFDDPFEKRFPDDSVIFKHLASRIRAF
ncbi:unnamed protein product [Onchocerca ochengi]|uniref:Secreted protein n=2 Tax=Onchocerca TaxID=6281 RepID=A0A182EKH0_ONCOC|nr:unnamed protein product [Onchocerca ochengi]